MSGEKPPASESGDADSPNEPAESPDTDTPSAPPDADTPSADSSPPDADSSPPDADSSPEEESERPSRPDSVPPNSYLDQLDLDDVDVRDLLRSALAAPAERKPTSKVVQGVQRRIREASKGKYFGDGWSTNPYPKATFLVTGLIMLLIVVLAWLLLAPYGVH